MDGHYHILGQLEVASAKTVKELFKGAILVMTVVMGTELLIVGPLPCFLVKKCCGDPSHITNFDEPGYGGKLLLRRGERGGHPPMQLAPY